MTTVPINTRNPDLRARLIERLGEYEVPSPELSFLG